MLILSMTTGLKNLIEYKDAIHFMTNEADISLALSGNVTQQVTLINQPSLTNLMSEIFYTHDSLHIRVP